MRIHHLNCGTLTAIAPDEPRAVCHCLLIETDRDGLVLVDSGIGTLNIRQPVESLGEDFLDWGKPVLDPAETAIHQVEALGFKADDVRHVIITHLHRDHVGGLPDFPDAAVHLHQAEHDAGTPGEGNYYSAAWKHGPRWVTYDGSGERWHGFDDVRQFNGLPPDLLLVPTAGHSPGHIAVAVRDGDGWLVHAGDAFFHRNELASGSYPEALDVLRAQAETDTEGRMANLDRLRELATDDQVQLVCAHDPVQFRQALKSGR